MSSTAGQCLSLSARQEMYKARGTSSSPHSCLAQSPDKPTIHMEMDLLSGPGMPASHRLAGFYLPSLVPIPNAVYAILTEALRPPPSQYHVRTTWPGVESLGLASTQNCHFDQVSASWKPFLTRARVLAGHQASKQQPEQGSEPAGCQARNRPPFCFTGRLCKGRYILNVTQALHQKLAVQFS